MPKPDKRRRQAPAAAVSERQHTIRRIPPRKDHTAEDQVQRPGRHFGTEALQNAAGRTADEIGKRVRNRQAVMQRINHDRNDAQAVGSLRLRTKKAALSSSLQSQIRSGTSTHAAARTKNLR